MSKPLTKAQKDAIIYKIKQNREAKIKEIKERIATSFVPTEEQLEILNDITLLEGIDFNLFIIEIFYTRYLDEYSNYLKSKTDDIQSLYMIKFGLCVVLVGIIIFLYFGVVYKKYLEKTIYAKAMILLIPRSELEKEGNYKIMKKFE